VCVAKSHGKKVTKKGYKIIIIIMCFFIFKWNFLLRCITIILNGSFHPILITVVFNFLLTFSTVNAVIYLKIIVLSNR